MTVDEILEQAKTLTSEQRDELVARLQALPDVSRKKSKTGAEIVAMLQALEQPIEFVDEHIQDPVEWVKSQRQKRRDKLKPYWDGDA